MGHVFPRVRNLGQFGWILVHFSPDPALQAILPVGQLPQQGDLGQFFRILGSLDGFEAVLSRF